MTHAGSWWNEEASRHASAASHPQPPRIPTPLITAALHASDAQLIAAVSASVCKPPLATKRLASSHELLLAKAFFRTEVKSWGCVRGVVRVSLVGV